MGSEDRATKLAKLVGGLAIVAGLLLAALATWTCDDAFISFRYAENLVEGHGLVFNPGERVEGYTNLLWTVWIAAGLALGFSATTWSIAWGLFAYGLAIALLVWHHCRLREQFPAGPLALPVAALVTATHGDWNHYATSGLETSAFTTLSLAGYLVVARGLTGGPHRPALAGVLLALAALTRPDGALFAAIGGVAWLWSGPGRHRAMLVYGLAFVAVWGPPNVWRVVYYGDFFPNTYYAKSAYDTWYEQGWHYFSLYADKYWPLLLAPVLAAVQWLRLRRLDAQPRVELLQRHALLAFAFAAVYIFYVIRVGGGFMYARLLIPVTPYLAILAELGILPLASRRPWLHVGLAAAIVTLPAVLPRPVSARDWVHGVADEWDVYTPRRVARAEHKAAVWRKYFHELPVHLAFMGMEARAVYLADIPVAIEAATGLTDSVIARRPLEERGRPGHEKRAPVPYLIGERKAHFLFAREGRAILELDRWIPVGIIELDDLHGYILHWDPELMTALKRRGANFVDFPNELDRFIARLDELPKDVVAREFAKIQLFYFDHVDDPEREAAFRQRLARPD